MDRLVSIPGRVLSYQGSKAEKRARLRVQRIVSIPVRVLGLPKSSLGLTLPYLRSYRKMVSVTKKFI